MFKRKKKKPEEEKQVKPKGEKKFAAAAAAAAAILEAIIDGVSIADVNANIVQANRAFVKMLGCESPEDLIGKSLVSFIAEKDIPMAMEEFKRCVTGGRVVNVEFNVKRKDGSEFPCMLNGVTLKDEKGNIVGLIGTLRDITEIRRLQEKEKEAAADKVTAGMIEAMVDGVTVIDIKGNITKCNKAFAKMHGYEFVDELLGKNPTELVPKREIPKVIESIEECMKKGFVRNIESIGMRKNGSEFPIQLNVTILKDEIGKSVGLIAVLRDITEIKRLQEEAVKMKEATILDATVDAVGVSDLNGNIIQANTACAKLFGYSKVDEVIGINFLDYIAKEELERSMEGFKKAISEGVDRNRETVFLDKDRKRVPIQLNATLLKDANGNPVGVIAVMRDITELKKAQEEAQKEAVAREMGKITEAVIDGVGLTDMNGNILRCNIAMANIFGYTNREELIGRSITELIPEREIPRVMEGFKKCLETGVTVNFEFIAKDKNGREFPIMINAITLKDDKGNLVGVVAVLRDISEIVRIREELQAKLKELEDFHDVAVGTELEMKKLEEEVERLKKELEKKG